jgi:hypothetical protein
MPLFSLNMNSVRFFVISMAIDFTDPASTSRPRRKMRPRLSRDVRAAPCSWNLGKSRVIPEVEPKVSQWYAVRDGCLSRV